MTLTKANTLAAINNTTVKHQINVLARRILRLGARSKYLGSVKKVEAFYIL